MEWITAREAVKLTGRNRRNIYQWARKGYVQTKIEKLNSRQTVGTMLFSKADVERVSHAIGQGSRLDLFTVGMYEAEYYPRQYAPKNYTFTERQLEIARKALENANIRL